jgi:hypothetical protein
MNKLVKNLNDIIDSGIKIHSVDEESRKIEIIGGVEISGEKSEVLISSHQITFDEELKAFTNSAKFRNALFSPLERGIILIDIAGYSKGNTLHQAAVLTIFNQVIKHTLDILKEYSGRQLVEQVVPTGDGCYIVLNECINDKFFRALLTINSAMHTVQNKILERFSKDNRSCEKLRIRTGCTINETDFFYDAAGNRNCYGTGMNEAARILSYGQKTAESLNPGTGTYDTIFFDDSIYSQAKPIIDVMKKIKRDLELVDLGKVADKHGITRRIWWLRNMPRYLSFNLFSEA